MTFCTRLSASWAGVMLLVYADGKWLSKHLLDAPRAAAEIYWNPCCPGNCSLVDPKPRRQPISPTTILRPAAESCNCLDTHFSKLTFLHSTGFSWVGAEAAGPRDGLDFSLQHAPLRICRLRHNSRGRARCNCCVPPSWPGRRLFAFPLPLSLCVPAGCCGLERRNNGQHLDKADMG